MVKSARVTEFQAQFQAKWWDHDQHSGHPTAEDESFADPLVHDGHVMQGFADGYVATVRHGSQEKNSVIPNRSLKNTWHTSLIGNGPITWMIYCTRI